MNKKRPETTYNEHEATWKDLEKTDSNFMEPLYLKNNQLEGSNVKKKQQIKSVFAIFRIICADAKWWQAEKLKQMSEQNETKQENVE